MPIRRNPESETDEHLEAIARRVLRVPTLQARGDDRRDIYEVAVWDLAQALREAFEAGSRSRGPVLQSRSTTRVESPSTAAGRPRHAGTITPLLYECGVWLVARFPRLISAGQKTERGDLIGSGSDVEAFWNGNAWRTGADEAIPFKSFNEASEFIETNRRRLDGMG